ncbi:hypothetical protein EYF80_047445 [Liparis tanakae]|uniref:Uncharacterized protein n=1 Tax=Liparis tanakae TaxID=230148 RepID=A0A4Z2FNF3_9TELE|nr:hypothetical protein EYF80_047445 [Liparis tanakae]
MWWIVQLLRQIDRAERSKIYNVVSIDILGTTFWLASPIPKEIRLSWETPEPGGESSKSNK